jgi:hypothetical protein
VGSEVRAIGYLFLGCNRRVVVSARNDPGLIPVRLHRRWIGYSIENAYNNHQAQQTRNDSEFHNFARFVMAIGRFRRSRA